MEGKLSDFQTIKGLRQFIFASGMWGAWGQAVGIGGAIFTGYALWLGIKESHIAFIASIASAASLAQLFSSLVAPHIRRRKVFVVVAGCLETFFRFSVILIPLWVPSQGRLWTVMVLLALGLLCGHTVSPLYSSWLATTIPAQIRARFLSKQTIVTTLVAMGTGYLLGQFLDLFPEEQRYRAFSYVFLFGLVTGAGGYLALLRAPFPPEMSNPSAGSLRGLLTPFRNDGFRSFLLFYLAWSFASSIAAPFYSVFMLKTLKIPYLRIMIFGNIFMGVTILGYKLWAGLVDQYGGKPVLRLLTVPAALMPILWIFNAQDNYLLIPIAMGINGLIHSGISVATTPLLYKLMPETEEKTRYFASWSISISLLSSVGPLIGAALVRHFESVHLMLGGIPIGNLQIMFLLSTCCMLPASLLVGRVQETSAASVRHIVRQITRGNPFSFAYNALLFSRSRSTEKRARAAHRMGSSRSPMALGVLTEALDDADPYVRSEAARGLGASHSDEAVSTLVEELEDPESDIRVEAAEALGRIGDPVVLEPLLNALRDEDPRIRISAIRSLAEIGGDEVRERLFWEFSNGFDRMTFPAFVDALSAMGELRIIKPTLERLSAYDSPVIRLQLLNAVCRTLGAGNRFYRLLSRDELGRVQGIHRLLRSLRKTISSDSLLRPPNRERILHIMGEISEALEAGRYRAMAASIGRVAAMLDVEVSDLTSPRRFTTARAADLAIGTLLDRPPDAEIRDTEILFLLVCLFQQAVTLRERETPQV